MCASRLPHAPIWLHHTRDCLVTGRVPCGARHNFNGYGYAPLRNEGRLLLRAHTATRPGRPMPSNSSEPGSGTGLAVNEPYSPGGGTPGPGLAFGRSTSPVAFARPAA